MSVPHLSGLSEIADRYDAFFLDIFGLLHNGVRANPGALNCLEKLKAAGKKICLVSNTPRLRDNVMQDLTRHGIMPSHYHHIVTAGESARVELSEKYRNKKVLFLGNEHFAAKMNGLNILQVQDIANADFILNSVAGILQGEDAQMLDLLNEGKNRGLKMLCANPDLVVHIGETLYICAGHYALLYEQLGGEVSYHGKPYRQIYEMASALLGHPDKSRICGIGDALRTDVRGACDYGIDSLWALSGIHWEELQYDHDPESSDPARVEKAISRSDHKPTGTITGFNW